MDTRFISTVGWFMSEHLMDNCWNSIKVNHSLLRKHLIMIVVLEQWWIGLNMAYRINNCLPKEKENRWTKRKEHQIVVGAADERKETTPKTSYKKETSGETQRSVVARAPHRSLVLSFTAPNCGKAPKESNRPRANSARVRETAGNWHLLNIMAKFRYADSKHAFNTEFLQKQYAH